MPERKRLTLVAALILKQVARSLDDEAEMFYPPSSVFLGSFGERGNKVRYISCSRMESALSHVVEDILASYDRVGGMNNTDANNLPSKRAIGGICEDMLQILFPGFHDEEAIHKKSLPVLTRHRVSSVMERLEEQVRQSMNLCDARRRRGLASPSLLEFFQTLPEVRDILHTDIEAAYEGDPAALNREEVILSYPFVEAIAIQRLAHRLHRAGVPIIPRMMTEWAHGRTGIDIHPGATIGSCFSLIMEQGWSWARPASLETT